MNLTAVLEFLNLDIKCQPIELSNITLDSRSVTPGTLFIAIPGSKTDGRQFIQQAIERGAVAVLVADQLQPSDIYSIPVIFVANLAARVATIAAFFYANPARHLNIIGITGTNGKTSTSHYTAQILSTANIACGVMGTLGNGVLGNLHATQLTTSDPCTVQKQFAEFVHEKISVVAMEVSSHALAQNRLAGTNFHTAVFTNLTQDHLDYHADMQDYFATKARLFTEYLPQNCVINLDDSYASQLLHLIFEYKNNIASPQSYVESNTAMSKIYTYSIDNRDADIYLVGDQIHTPWGTGKFCSRLIGKFNTSNLLACITCCALQGMELEDVLQSVSNLQSVPGRMQIANMDGGCERYMDVFKRSSGTSALALRNKTEPLVVIDYAHTPDALIKALQALREHAANDTAKIYCVFGCGGDRDRTKRALMLDAVLAHSDYAIITQDNPRTEDPQQIVNDMINGRELTTNVKIILDRAQAIEQTIAQATAQDFILIAGKGHEDYQIIGTQKFPFSDLTIAQHALESIRSESAWAV